MATSSTTHRRRYLSKASSAEQESSALPPGDQLPPLSPLPTRSRWPRFLFLSLCAVLIVIGGAPSFIAVTPLRNTVLGWALEADQGSITSTGASLGWFSHIVFKGVEVRDADGEPLLTAQKVATSKSLLSLLLNHADLGTLTVEQPKLQLILRSQGSNLEDFIAPWLNQADSGPFTTALQVEVVEGKIQLADGTIGRQWHIEDIESQVGINGTIEPLAVKVAGNVTDGLEPGRIQAELKLPLAETSAIGEANPGATLWVQTQKVQLVMLHGLLARWVPDVHLFGGLSSDVQFAWGRTGAVETALIKGQWNVDQLTVESPYLKGDRLQLARLEVPCHVAVDGSDRLIVHDARLRCELGQAALSGTVNLSDLKQTDWLTALTNENYSLEAQVDLARLAAALPGTLSIRADTAVTSGSANLSLASVTDQTGHRWKGSLTTRNLAAQKGGKLVAWEQPIELQLRARRDAQGFTVDQLVCQADFLQVTAAGTPDKLAGRAFFDLNELMAKLGQFVDFGAWRLAGQGQADIAWNQSPEGAFRAGVSLDVSDFHMTTPSGQPWADQRLIIETLAEGKLRGKELVSLDSAAARIGAAPDELQATLAAPQTSINWQTGWPLQVELKGNIARWATRLKPFVSFDPSLLDGEAKLQSQLIASSTGVDVRQATLRLDQFSYTGGGLFIREPVLELTAVGKWTKPLSRLELKTATLRGNDLLLETTNAMLAWAESAGPSLAGRVHLATAVERLHGYTLDPLKTQENRAPGTWIFTGRIDGTADLRYANQQTSGELNVTLRPLSVLQRELVSGGRVSNQGRWSEAELVLSSAALYDTLNDRLHLTSTTLSGHEIAFAAKGTIDKLTSEMQLNLAGDLRYDLEQLLPLLQKYAGPSISFTGQETGTFAIRGPVFGTPDRRGVIPSWSQRLAGELSLGWKKGRAYGLDLGPGIASASLAQGLIRFAPLEVTLSEGKLTSAPVIQLDPEPAAFYLPKGPLLTGVRLSPEICDAWLKFAAPVLAEATRTDGKISIDLDGGRIPLAAPTTGDIGGRLVLHQVQVMPGPLANDYILLGQQLEALAKRRVPPTTLAGQQSALLGIADQTVNFRMVESRVYHQNLVAAVAGTSVTTQGSVGLDQTLSIAASMPVADRWLGSDPALQGFKGQTLQLQVGGTLSRPALDRNSLQQFTAQLVQGAVQNTIQNELSKQLDRLLPKQR